MPMTGPWKRLPAMAREIEKLGVPRSTARDKIAKAVVTEVRGVLKDQYATGTAPDGSLWKLTKRGKPALVSKKLPQDFVGVPVEAGASFASRIAWMKAHHEGHTFPARAQVLTYNKRGKLARRRRDLYDIATRQRVFRGKFVFDVAVNVKARVLPPRPVYPTGTMPDRWGVAINRGIADARDDFTKAVLK